MSRIVYVLIALSAIYQIGMLVRLSSARSDVVYR
nr:MULTISPECIES: hypothetical protein [unclassified Bradyrhizobium]